MDSKEHNRRELRTGIERLVRSSLSDEDYFVDDLSFWPQHGGGWKPAVGITTVNKEPPPLDATRQLALSVLLGEPVPTPVLLSAMEDAGMFPGGVFEAVKDEREKGLLDMGNPVYTPGERSGDGWRRWAEVVRDWYLWQRVQVRGVCKGFLGRGSPGVGLMFGKFLERWLGWRDIPPPEQTHWPTSEYLRDRMAKFPPLSRVFRHLRLTAKPETAELLDRLIAHMDSVPARSDLG